MIIKKYIGKTETEATEAAKNELGNNIVIMNVKEVRAKGVFALLRKKCIEITVALEGEQEKFSPLKKESVSEKIEEKFRAETKAEETKSIEEKLENLQNLLVSKLQQEEKLQDTEAAGEKGKGEVNENGAASEDEDSPDQEYVRFLKLIYNMMVDNEVDERYANQIIEGVDKNINSLPTYDSVLANIYQRMILKFGKSTGVVSASEGPKVIMFFGPTGVGKTTTIAKLASKFSLENKCKVALLTTDTYRIAAAEQLRTYANILQVPFRVIYTDEEIAAAIKDFYQFDYIFVDTTGHSHMNTEQNRNIKELLGIVKGLAETQNFLVLSMTTKYRDLLKIVDNYSAITDYELIFTKLDETYTLGNVLNVRLYTGKSVSYVTYGQNVPEDIECFDAQKTVKHLLGGKKQ